MRPLRHGYTNNTVGDASTVVKTYRGPDADLRRSREYRMLRHLRGHVPVPEIRGTEPGNLSLEFLSGSHGQDLIDSGSAAEVLRAAGHLLRRVQDVDIAGLELPPTLAVTGLLDWEFAHIGAPIEDLAWCEWIVRAHHATHLDALSGFFAGYGGPTPSWTERQAAMIDRCVELRNFCRRWDGAAESPAARMWAERAEAVTLWEE